MTPHAENTPRSERGVITLAKRAVPSGKDSPRVTVLAVGLEPIDEYKRLHESLDLGAGSERSVLHKISALAEPDGTYGACAASCLSRVPFTS